MSRLQKILNNLIFPDVDENNDLPRKPSGNYYKELHKRIGCSAFAIISEEFVDMLAEGKKVRLLPDNELGPHLRLISSARIESIKDMQNILKIILNYRITRILINPDELISRCVLVITVEEDQFLKRTGRLRKIGRPIIWVIYSQKELETEAHSIIMLLIDEYQYPGRVKSFTEILKSMGLNRQKEQLKSHGIFMGHVDLVLNELLNALDHFKQNKTIDHSNKFLNKNKVSTETLKNKYQGNEDYRDHLIHLCEVEIQNLKKQLLAKLSKAKCNYDELKKNDVLPQEIDTNNSHKILEKANIKCCKNLQCCQQKLCQLVYGEDTQLNSVLKLLKQENERIDTDIRLARQLIAKQKQQILNYLSKAMNLYLPKFVEIAYLSLHYNYVKAVEMIGVDDSKCRDVIKKCFYWDENQLNWLMKPKLKKLCLKILKITYNKTGIKTVTYMEVFKIYVQWKYKFSWDRNSQEQCEINKLNSFDNNILLKKLQLTYEPLIKFLCNLSKDLNIPKRIKNKNNKNKQRKKLIEKDLDDDF